MLLIDWKIAFMLKQVQPQPLFPIQLYPHYQANGFDFQLFDTKLLKTPKICALTDFPYRSSINIERHV